MKISTIPVIAAVACISLLPAIVTWYIRYKSTLHQSLNDFPIRFHVAPFILGIISLNFGIAVLWFVIPLNIPNTMLIDWVIFGIIGVCWFFASLSVFKKSKNSYVLITEEKLFYQYGKKKKEINCQDIASVDLINGYILISSKTKKNKLMIPMVFRGNSQLLLVVKKMMRPMSVLDSY